MRVLIVGGGIAGPVLALLLVRAGHEVEIFDRVEAPSGASDQWQPADIGGGLSLFANSLRVFRRLGLLDELTARSTKLKRTESRKFNDEVIARFNWKSRDTFDDLDILRTTIARVVNEALNAEGVRVKAGKRLVHLEQAPGGSLGVTAHFADGTTASGDILVGADGINSVARSVILPGILPIKSDFVGYLGVSEVNEDVHWNDDTLIFHLDPSAGRSTWIARSTATRAVWCLYETKPGQIVHESWEPVKDVDNEKKKMADMATEWNLPAWVSKLIMNSVRITPVTFRYLEPLPTWHKQNVVLIGDACHAILPFAGQGAGISIEDAEVLATMLSKLPGKPHEAFALFEEMRRPRIDFVIRTTAGIGKSMNSTGVVGAFVGRFMLRLAAFLMNKLGVDLLNGPLQEYDPYSATLDFLKGKGISV
ncbi:hypothetical protein HK405_004494 [Cladochytrium tenue]|nr:hypothetical protein HK405_004494 [Cladochytrium tenue]